MKSVKHRKLSCYCPEKESSTSSEEHCANLPELTHEGPARALELTQVWWQTKHTWEDSERLLSAVSFCRFTLALLSHHVFHLSTSSCQMTRQHLAGFWIVSINLCAWCPCGWTLWSRSSLRASYNCPVHGADHQPCCFLFLFAVCFAVLGWWDANLAGDLRLAICFWWFVFWLWWFASLHATTCVHVEVS